MTFPRVGGQLRFGTHYQAFLLSRHSAKMRRGKVVKELNLMIKKSIFIALVTAVSAFGATWTGQVSENGCGVSHAKMKAADKSLKTDRDCTLACIKSGAKFVLVSDGKVYDISNQNFAALTQYAGETVQVDGTMAGNTITVTKVGAPGKK